MVRDKTLEMIPEGDYSVRDYMDHAGVGGPVAFLPPEPQPAR